ncbi:tautomerase family protein [Paraburkholderia sp. ZP32-5]|uniref:tautomerase family protein n=1 Tax=Paraburkholderia sp. ZP32-5 TaxID=2883245 RepID=UPI001F3EA841|nr:tautomerase family protein [Paraburkholderia sp. ZP32-5]
MPVVRIDLSRSATRQVVQAISDTIYQAMTDVANVPANDKFQIVTLHDPDELIYPIDGYLGTSYSPSIVFIQVTWNAGRSIEVKKAFYAAVADGINRKTGIRKEDVFINLVDVSRENWSFGNGEMQYAPAE